MTGSECHSPVLFWSRFVFTGSIRVVRGEGMPHYRNPFEKGDLYIKFDVLFPDNNWINPEKLAVSDRGKKTKTKGVGWGGGGARIPWKAP